MRLAIPLFVVALGACDHGGAPAPTTRVGPVIYGTDDRVEVPDAPEAARLAAPSVAVLVTSDKLTQRADGTWNIATSSTLGASQSLCASEPFREQPDPGFCSGVMVGPDLIATAGHCIDDTSCAGTRFVFDWGLTSERTVKTTLASDTVYRCVAVLGRQRSTSDWAVVRVDRAITGRAPLAVRSQGTIADAASLAVIGHPFGIPAKVAGNAQLQGNTAPEYFSANLDTYAGNSGSPVFDASFSIVEGLLVRGNADLVAVGKGKNRCYASNVCDDSGCPGHEDVTRATEFAYLVGSEPPPTCEDDHLEDNDAMAQATALAGDVHLPDMTICAGDSDWFKVFVDAGDVLTATATFTHADGNLDLELRDGLGGLMASSATLTDDETVSHAPRSFGGTIHVVVKGVAGAQNDYALTLSVTAPPPPDNVCGNGVCEVGESCDGRAGTASCTSDCPGRTSGTPRQRFCWVDGVCDGPGC